MAQGTVTRPRIDAWERAMQRALDECLDVLIEPISGAAFVEITSRPGTLYAVTSLTCTCAAGANGMPCKHRAAYLAQTMDGPSPVAPAAVVDVAWSEGSADIIREQEADARADLDPVIECADCCGCGVVWYRTHEQRCDVCEGCGVVAA